MNRLHSDRPARARRPTRGQPTTARARLPMQHQRDTGADHGRTDGRADHRPPTTATPTHACRATLDMTRRSVRANITVTVEAPEHAARRHRLPGGLALRRPRRQFRRRHSLQLRRASKRASRAPSSSARASRARTVHAPAGGRAASTGIEKACAAARRTARPSTINYGRSRRATRTRGASPS